MKDKILSPRFAVAQGVKPDGSLKIRPIDDFTASGCNAHTVPAEKLKCDTLDLLLASMRRMFEDSGGKVRKRRLSTHTEATCAVVPVCCCCV